MNAFGTLMLLAWLPITVAFFSRMQPHRAVLACVILGWLLLPMGTAFNISGWPPYNKNLSIALGLLLAGGLSRNTHGESFQWSLFDLPMILFCLSPIPASMTNGLGLYDGIAHGVETVITYGVPYYAGRLHFNTPEKIKDLCLGLVMGGIVYVPLALWEMRMSPRLSTNIYGFFSHSWRQHSRYGRWRPIVFMQHGLMVALWFAATTTAAFWLWKAGVVRRIKGVPMGLIVLGLAVTTVLCMSANGWISLILGCGAYFVYRRSRSNRVFLALLVAVPVYVVLRIYGLIQASTVTGLFASVLDEDRVGSLAIRLFQEDLFVERVMDRLAFGWGRMGRAWPVDEVRGRALVTMIDSTWLILLSVRGVFGLGTWIAAMLTGPWTAFRTRRTEPDGHNERDLIPVVLGLVVVMFMIDSLLNAMVNPVYVLCTGGLVGAYVARQKTIEEDGERNGGVAAPIAVHGCSAVSGS